MCPSGGKHRHKKTDLNLLILYNFLAVREDRTPGGKHRHKRPKTDDPSSLENILTAAASENYDGDYIQQLVDAEPDLIPHNEGKKN